MLEFHMDLHSKKKMFTETNEFIYVATNPPPPQDQPNILNKLFRCKHDISFCITIFSPVCAICNVHRWMTEQNSNKHERNGNKPTTTYTAQWLSWTRHLRIVLHSYSKLEIIIIIMSKQRWKLWIDFFL